MLIGEMWGSGWRTRRGTRNLSHADQALTCTINQSAFLADLDQQLLRVLSSTDWQWAENLICNSVMTDSVPFSTTTKSSNVETSNDSTLRMIFRPHL